MKKIKIYELPKGVTEDDLYNKWGVTNIHCESIKELVCTNKNLKRINKIHRKDNGKLRQENKRLKHIEELYEGLLKDYDELLERIDTVMKIFEK